MGKIQHTASLTNQQRKLVRAHLWLVDLHLRKKVPGLRWPSGQRNRDDLYQEGCLGLIEAVKRYDPARGIPFVAFALPRIHTAVSRALWSGTSLIRLPRQMQRLDAARADAHTVPQTVPLEHEPADRAGSADPSALVASGDGAAETIGARLRAKYERAVSLAVEQESRVRTRRDDRRLLLERLASQRFLVPHDEHRTSLRQIARETGSSIARVVQCEQRLRDRIGCILSQNPQVQRLREEARAHPLGTDGPIDDALHCELRELVEQKFMAAFSRARPEQRGEMVTRLIESCGRSVGEFVRILYTSLPREQQDVLLSETRALAG